MRLGKFSFGHGDRFAHQGRAQLAAVMKAVELGAQITPVWNKSNREHQIVHTTPDSVRQEADAAVKALGWTGQYCVDADHVGLKTVDPFIAASDFFTLDVADFIGEKASEADIASFVESNKKYLGKLVIPDIEEPFTITEELIRSCAEQYLFAVQEARRIFDHITSKKPADQCIIEVSMDETEDPQTPVQMFFILSMIAAAGIPAQTIAPKFTGRFNKGVDYVGDVGQFTKEFEEDIAVINFAVREFGLNDNLKLSVHSGSDKFSIYGPIAKALKKFDAGLHLKTAGTTWLEELIGLAEAGGEGLEIAKRVYVNALARFDELCQPYASVIDIDPAQLPHGSEVKDWDGKKYAETLRHDQSNPNYNQHFRQLLHVGYKVAVELGDRYYQALKDNEEIIAKNVTENIFERHLKPLFLA